MSKSIKELMVESGVKFGTSGARGLAEAMTDRICYAYTTGFLQYLESIGELPNKGMQVAIAGDLRPSTDRIMEAVRRAAVDRGYLPVNGGKIPSPALALHGFAQRIPAIMVTGSHIPDDRNGIKFNKCSGEVLKEDEGGMAAQVVAIPEYKFTESGAFAVNTVAPWPVEEKVRTAYIRRYLDVFPADALSGARIGVYQHSAVGRDVLVEILQGLGAEVVALGRSERFIPVDTEAIREEDMELARKWAGEQKFDAIVSADGDSDRPLIADEHGKWLRGDVAGIFCARYLGADSVSTPVSCNTAVERSQWFAEVRRTKIGSPYVVASMLAASAAGAKCVVGYEANGGFLLNSDIAVNGQPLKALPTRDAVLVILGVLLLARQQGKTVTELSLLLPPRYTASGLLKDFPVEKSQAVLARFNCGNHAGDCRALEEAFGNLSGKVKSVERTDGVRVTFMNGEVVHLRPSGNAPEFRCYTEADTEERAGQMTGRCLEILRRISL